MARKGISEELANSIREFYLSRPMSLSDVCEKFGVSHPTACKVLKDVPKYPKSRVFNPNMAEDYFKDIDTEKKAYFIGLMIADGNVFDNPNTKEANRQASISIMLKEEDEYIYKGISSQNYVFSLKIGANIDKDKIKAKNSDGVLCVSLPFKDKEPEPPKQITNIEVE
jgi:hypothetical protein